MAELGTEVRYVKGIGEKKAQALKKLGVLTLYDLVSYFPRRYEDRSQFKSIALTLPDETVCIRAMNGETRFSSKELMSSGQMDEFSAASSTISLS